MSKKSIGRIVVGALTDNLWLKLVSLLIALGFYAFIHSAQNAQRTVGVKLVVEKPQETVNRQLMSDIPAAVDVTLVGPLQQIEQVSPDELSITLDLTAAQSIPELKITDDMVTGLPPRVRVDRIQPSRLKIRFEEIISRELRVQIARAGEPAEGMEVTGKILVEPAVVTATGIESAVSTIQLVSAEHFDVSGLGEGSFKRRLKLGAPPDDVTWSQDSVAATVEVARKLTTIEFPNLEVEVVGLAVARVRPRTVTVKVTGAPGEVDAIHKDAIVPRVSPKQAGADLSKPGGADVPVIVDIPNVQVTVIPPTVFVKW